ncbi:CoxG family protein [Rubellimicrobium aerolatum]|uniref:CoxG family protein n=1 Tax=Rubellimicrobium aerolatum TaxID=490979 RepID=A0ABW0SBY6_9RHOB|nr:SRPBCC domain-containing protein [Rubellimicrobium aerolatum]MBP1806006.1 carbon monoxide dehydrogenase subunit G [Rubellimicrobium aerolatum]
MQLTGEKILAAPPEAVWTALIDPVFLKALIPGCQEMSGSPEAGYDIVVERGVGGMTARMTGRFDLREVQPGQGCLLVGGGSGGAVGQARGKARIRLSPEGRGTRLAWDIAAELEGKLAGIPQFVVNMAARKVADGFVERFAAALERRPVQTKGWLGRIVPR